MLRRLHHTQPDSFAFTPANIAWAKEQMKKFPEGRQASAVIPLLWRAQEQEGWVSKPAIETVAEMLGLADIRVLEVATFYFMFQLAPVGTTAHVQVCGTTSCMICGAEDLISVCKDKIAANAHDISEDGRFSWEEVECLGACANAPMVQIGKDFYEDLTAEKFSAILDAFARGEVPKPGPQNGRFAAEPLSGLTSLNEFRTDGITTNASVARAETYGDTIARIKGDEVALTPAPQPASRKPVQKPSKAKATSAPKAPAKAANTKTAVKAKAKPAQKAAETVTTGAGKKPRTMAKPRAAGADDLKLIKGIGPKMEKMCNSLGFWHFDQVAKWSAAEVSWVDQNLEGFKGRVSRDDWVAQAKILAAGGQTEFSAKK